MSKFTKCTKVDRRLKIVPENFDSVAKIGGKIRDKVKRGKRNKQKESLNAVSRAYLILIEAKIMFVLFE